MVAVPRLGKFGLSVRWRSNDPAAVEISGPGNMTEVLDHYVRHSRGCASRGYRRRSYGGTRSEGGDYDQRKGIPARYPQGCDDHAHAWLCVHNSASFMLRAHLRLRIEARHGGLDRT
jgi:hypothetical protein